MYYPRLKNMTPCKHYWSSNSLGRFQNMVSILSYFHTQSVGSIFLVFTRGKMNEGRRPWKNWLSRKRKEEKSLNKRLVCCKSFGCPGLCLTNKSVLGNFDGLRRMPHEIWIEGWFSWLMTIGISSLACPDIICFSWRAISQNRLFFNSQNQLTKSVQKLKG